MARKRTIYASCLVLVLLVGAGILAFLKPVIVIENRPGVFVRNQGRLEAVIFRVDGFWYWGGQVAMLANIPDIRQRVTKHDSPVRLQIPDMPFPPEYGIREKTCFMKLAIRYSIPGIPVFRFATRSYFEYDEKQETWVGTKQIPPKHRALGSLTVGDVGKIELNFK